MNTDFDETRDPLDQAAAWIARLRADDADLADRQAFARWLAADPVHAGAFDTMLELWCDLGMLQVLPVAVPQSSATRTRIARWRVPLALAASLAFLALLLVPRPATRIPLELRTPIGGFEQVRLEDGSQLTLNTDTALDVVMGNDARVTHLVHGEVFFRVAPDAERPFTAVCATAAVTVLGTAFNASCDTNAMNVLVEEGVVRFGAWPANNGEDRLLHAGDRARFDPRTGTLQVDATGSSSLLAWRNRQLVFEDVTLAVVIAELQRYMKPTLSIVNKDAAAMHVSGVFSTSEPLLTLQALEKSLGITVDGPEQGPLLIGLHKD
jgi:transmembrane sensor